MSRIYYKLFPGIPGNCGISKKFPDVAPDNKGCLPLMTRCQYHKTTTSKTNKPNIVPSFFLQTRVGNWLISLLKSWEDLVSVNDTACPIAPGLGFGAKNLKLMQKGREGVPYRSFQNGCAVKSVCNDDNCKVYRQGESITITMWFQLLRKVPVQWSRSTDSQRCRVFGLHSDSFLLLKLLIR